MWTLGLEMEMGPVSAVQTGSPAAQAGIHAGDRIQAIDGSSPGDPMTLPDRMRRRAGQKVEITVLRDGSDTPDRFTLQARQPIQFSPPAVIVNSAVAADALGIAYHVTNRVHRVAQGSPAAKAGLAAGDVLRSATINPPNKETLEKLQYEQPEQIFRFSETENNWPSLVSGLQAVAPGTTVDLTFSRDKEEQTAKGLEPFEAGDWFSPDRGFLFDPLIVKRTADSIAEALALGGRETLDNLTLVFRTVGAEHESRFRPEAGRAVGDHQDRRGLCRPGHVRVPDLPHHAQREPGRVEYPAHPGAGRGAPRVPALRRRPRQTGQRTRAGRADLYGPGPDYRPDALGYRPRLRPDLAALTVAGTLRVPATCYFPLGPADLSFSKSFEGVAAPPAWTSFLPA